MTLATTPASTIPCHHCEASPEGCPRCIDGARKCDLCSERPAATLVDTADGSHGTAWCAECEMFESTVAWSPQPVATGHRFERAAELAIEAAKRTQMARLAAGDGFVVLREVGR